jgi:Tol biopolymer transport system component
MTRADETLRSTDIWVVDTTTGARTRVTDDPRWDQHPAWSADGNGIFYSSGRDQRPGVYLQPLDGGPERFITDTGVRQIEPSPNGVELLLSTAAGIERVSLEAPAAAQVWQPEAGAPSFSPDGRHVAYISGESGSRQLYVRPLDGEGRHRVATSCSANLVRWGRDGREIYFACDDDMVAVPVQDAGALRFGDPEPLFSLADAALLGGFDVDANGRFLLRRIEDADQQRAAGFIQNWPRLLESPR